eukprot:1850389-Rhodomonas_salina.10
MDADPGSWDFDAEHLFKHMRENPGLLPSPSATAPRNPLPPPPLSHSKSAIYPPFRYFLATPSSAYYVALVQRLRFLSTPPLFHHTAAICAQLDTLCLLLCKPADASPGLTPRMLPPGCGWLEAMGGSDDWIFR